MKKLTDSALWLTLAKHHSQIAQISMRDLFSADPQRFNKFSLSAGDLLLDYSKNRIHPETLPLLCQLAEAANLPAQIEQLFQGHIVNGSENRAALHTALRQQNDEPVLVAGKNVIPEIRATQKRMQQLIEAIFSGRRRGFHEHKFTDVVNIGIGGSDLGPAMVSAALKPYSTPHLHCHFVSNVDGSQITDVLKNLNPETTLFIISSKSFSTSETLCNANTAKQWLLQKINNVAAIKNHFIAVTTKTESALKFGIAAENIFPLWDWVGGRYSLWSAVGLPIALQIGFDNFNQLLAGAYAMDQHFRHTPFAKNMPVIMALLSIWYVNFFQAQSQAILPYDHHLQLLPAYLQQAHMESHGKQLRQDGSPVDYATGPVIWGGVGTNGQHTFHQLLHQGTQLIPVDFIVAAKNNHSLQEHHNLLFANCLSQSQALMLGKNYSEIIDELIAQGLSETEAKQLAPHKAIPGNRPSNTILMPQLTPFTLGALIALYEHKIFAQSVIWNINCFDQWGVELGKQLATNILDDLQNCSETCKRQDASTYGLMTFYRQQQSEEKK